MTQATIETDRLCLRWWRESDLTPFAELNGDREVMEFFVCPLSEEQSNAFVRRIRQHFRDHGFGLWAVEIPGVSSFAGFVGLQACDLDTSFAPCVEVGWRLARRHWGNGYATEGALAAVRHGFDVLGLEEIISMTASINTRSERVMQKIGMVRDPAEDFDHPRVPDGHALKRHVLYRIQPERLRAQQ